MKALSGECPTKANRRLQQGYKNCFRSSPPTVGATSSHKRNGERGDREVDRIDKGQRQQANNLFGCSWKEGQKNKNIGGTKLL